MGSNGIQVGTGTGIHYTPDTGPVEGPQTVTTSLNAEQIAELRQALALLDGEQAQAATRGVPAPDPDQRVDVVGLGQALDGAEGNVSTDIYAFMALFTQMAQQMRKVAKEQRQSELQNQVSSINSSADKMLEAAEKRFAAAVVQGSMQIAGGAISIGAGAVSIKASASAKTADFNTGSKFLTDLNAKQSIASGSGQVLSGLGSVVAGGIEFGAAQDDADAKRLEADGTAAQARRETAQEIAQNMSDLIKDIREQLRAIAQSNIETNRGMARNI